MSTFNDKPDIKQVRCPQCQTRVPWTEDSLFRPFCSKRCQLIDFGDWANEKHSIPTKEAPEDFELDDFED